MSSLIDLTGKKFGRLFVVGIAKRNKFGAIFWKCFCDCGKIKEVRSDALRGGKSKSCGCYSRERASEVHRKSPGSSGLSSIYNSYKSAARKRSLPFNIDIEFFKKLTSSNCYYCGAKPKKISRASANYTEEGIKNSEYVYNGIDRINNDIGYLEDNIVSCCYYCNMSKHTRTQKEFFNWIERIYYGRKEKTTSCDS